MPDLNAIIVWLQSVVNNINNLITGGLNNALQGITNLGNSISGVFNSVLNTLKNTWDAFINVMGNWFTSFITNMQALVNQLVQYIGSVMDTLADTISQVWQNLITSLYNWMQPLLNSLLGAIQSLYASAVSWFESIYQAIVNKLRDFIGSIVAQITNILTPLATWVIEVGDKIKIILDKIILIVTDVYETLTSGIKRAFDELFASSQGLAETIATKFSDVGRAFDEATTKIIDLLQIDLGPNAKAIKETVTSYFGSLANAWNPTEIGQMANRLEVILGDNPIVAGDRAGWNHLVKSIGPTSDLGAFVFQLVFSVGFCLQAYSGIANAQTSILLQEFATQYPYQVLSPADAALAHFKGNLTQEQAIENIRRSGFSVEQANILLANSFNVPQSGELLAMKLRGIIDPQRFSRAMKTNGFDEAWADAYTAIAQIIPPVSDLITMAVKGAFSEDEIATFRTKEDFPEAIVEWCEKQGLSREWMLRYWMAHWNLPSAGQGFEMFQRAAITEPQLKVLLKALDITPFWRDALIKISYNTLTRVDVRRMHQLGLLNEAGVERAHLDMGYTPEHAKLLTQFVVDLNSSKPGVSDEELGRLSRTNIVNFYQDGVITRERAIQLLVGVGYTPEAATLFIDTADFDAERTIRTAEIDFIIASAQAGILTFEAAQDQLNELHLSPTEIEKAVTKLLREQAKATKLPNLDQATDMFNAGIISEPKYKDTLKRLGYSAEWQNAFVALARKKTTKPS